jgi:DNA-binding CsgD family transcriptional regulator
MHLQNYIEKTFIDSQISYYVKEKQHGKYTNVNQAFLDAFNMSSVNEVLGQNDINLWRGKAPSFCINDQKIILAKKPDIFIEDMIFANTKQFYLSCKSPLYSQSGKIIGIFGVSFPFNNKSFNNFPEDALEAIKLFQSTLHKSNFTIQKNVTLSNRQKECLHYLARGMTIKEIARALNLSPKTIENYLGALKIKLDCFTRAELVEKAFEFCVI